MFHIRLQGESLVHSYLLFGLLAKTLLAASNEKLNFDLRKKVDSLAYVTKGSRGKVWPGLWVWSFRIFLTLTSVCWQSFHCSEMPEWLPRLYQPAIQKLENEDIFSRTSYQIASSTLLFCLGQGHTHESVTGCANWLRHMFHSQATVDWVSSKGYGLHGRGTNSNVKFGQITKTRMDGCWRNNHSKGVTHARNTNLRLNIPQWPAPTYFWCIWTSL